MADGELLAGVPGVIVQGSLDVSNLVGTPWLLASAWPGCELELVDDVGHDTRDALAARLVAATDRFGGR